MNTRIIGRLSAAAALAVGLLIATALPSAAVTHDLYITDSSTIAVGTTLTHFGGHSTDNVCAPNSEDPTGIPVTFDSTGGGVFGASTTGYGDFVAGANTFKSRLIITGGTVAITHTTIAVTLTIRAEFRTCDSQTLLCQTNLLTVTLTGANPTPSTLHPSTSTSGNVSGNVHVTVPITCNAVIRAAINSQLANISLNYHLV